LIEAANCGLWLPPEDPAALVEAIRHLYTDPGLRTQMGSNGRRHVETFYTRQAVARQYAALLERLTTPVTWAAAASPTESHLS
jgi:colanic acid biosynthesis glycosyl transferase WcaI